ELEAARAARDKVWLLMHIPPGLDSFATAASVRQNGPPVPLWQPELTSRFLQLVRTYQGTIQASFASHMHRDDFRVIRLDGKPAFFSKIASSISPIYGNNPGFYVVQYERETGLVQDYQMYYLTNLGGAGPTDPRRD